MYDGMNLYRAVVAYASSTTGDIRVRIPAILGPTEVLPISKIGRAAVEGTWQVPLLGSQVVVAIEDDRFSNIYMVYPNLAVIQEESGGGEGPPPEPPAEIQYVPSGSIMQFAGASVPSGWLLCDGTPKSTTEFANLFEAIGYTYGGSGASFNVPNLRGKVPVGRDSSDTTFAALNNTGGNKERSIAVANMPQHNHTLNSHTHSMSHSHTIGHTHSGSTGFESPAHSHTVSGGSHQHNVPFFVGVYTAGGAGTGPVGAAGTSNVLTTSGGGGHSHDVGSGGHSHAYETGQPSNSSSGGSSSSNTGSPSTTNTGDTGSATPTAFSVLQPYIVVNYIIKV